MGNYQEAVNWIIENMSGFVEHGWVGGEAPPWIITEDELRVRFAIDFWDCGSNETPMLVSEAQAQALFDFSETRRGAFDLARHASASYIYHQWQLPEGLRVFSTLYLGGQLKEPNMVRTDKNFLRKFIMFTSATISSEKFGLTLTRNDEGESSSACDAVVDAMAKIGYHIGFRSVKDICVGSHKSESDFRLKHAELVEDIEAFWLRKNDLKSGWVDSD